MIEFGDIILGNLLVQVGDQEADLGEEDGRELHHLPRARVWGGTMS
jgi:hypothetical protein